jgi:hypothetical protein
MGFSILEATTQMMFQRMQNIFKSSKFCNAILSHKCNSSSSTDVAKGEGL